MTRRTWRVARRAVLGGGSVALALMLLPSAGTQLTGGSGGSPVTCAPGRSAETYTGTGQVLTTASAVVPCAGTTGFGGAETRIVVTAGGSLVVEPAIETPGLLGTGFLPGAPGPRPSTQLSPGGLAVRAPGGSTWSFVEPGSQTWVPQDDQLYADRTTGWLYYYALSPDPVPQSSSPVITQLPAGYAQLEASPDGTTWYHTALPGFVESENPRFTSAPAPAGGAVPSGADIVYWCGNNMLFTPSYRACYRSLDSGRTWNFASVVLSTPLPQHPQCGDNGETFGAGDGNFPQGAPDGSLYELVACGSTTYLSRSTDEAATWPLVDGTGGAPVRLPGDGELRVGPDGSLYLVVQSGDALNLWVSTDGGRTWRGPQDLTMPGATAVNEWFMAESGDGEVAVSYLADNPASSGLDAYLSVTRDALDADPVIYGATLEDPSVPDYAGSPTPARDDFVGVDIAPDGTPWASFFASCSATDPDPGCAGQSGNSLADKTVVGSLSGLGPLP